MVDDFDLDLFHNATTHTIKTGMMPLMIESPMPPVVSIATKKARSK